MIYVSDLWNQEEGEPIKFMYLRLLVDLEEPFLCCMSYEGCKVQLCLLDDASVCTFNNFKAVTLEKSSWLLVA